MENKANSEWLAENIKDQSVKEMPRLVEKDGNFVEKHGEGKLTKHELIARVKEICIQASEKKPVMQTYEAQVVSSDASLSSDGGISDATLVEGSDSSLLSSDSDSESCNSSPTERLNLLLSGKILKHDIVNLETVAAYQENSYETIKGGEYEISDATLVEGSDSSLLSSDSDTESCNSSPTERLNLLPSSKILKHDILNLETVAAYQENSYETIKGGEYEMLMGLSDYEKELKDSKEKLINAEEEITNLKNELLENEAIMTKMDNMETQLVSAENQIKLHSADLDKENKKSLMLQCQVVDLEAKLESEKRQVDVLQESVKNYTAELSDRDLVIQKLIADLQDASGSFALEKWQLESSVSKLFESLMHHEGRANELQKQCESLEAEKIEIIRKQEALQDNLEHVKTELFEKNSLVDTLNKNIDDLKLNHDTVMAEKDGVEAKLQTLDTDISIRNEQIQRMENNLLELQSENEKLHEGAHSANKITAEMKSRIAELEKEVEMQTAMISDTAEGKREAIKQLCFSLDYFRTAYQELREVYSIRKRPTSMAS